MCLAYSGDGRIDVTYLYILTASSREAAHFVSWARQAFPDSRAPGTISTGLVEIP